MEIWYNSKFIKNYSVQEVEKDYKESFLTEISFDFVKINKSVKRIGNNLFKNCFDLKTVEIQEGVTCIGANAFNKCFKLNKITLPKSIQKIEPGSFDNCNSLKIYAYKKFNVYQSITTVLISNVSKPQQIKKNIMKNYIKIIEDYKLDVVYPEITDRTVDELTIIDNAFDNIVKNYISLRADINQINGIIRTYNTAVYDDDEDLVKRFNKLKPSVQKQPVQKQPVQKQPVQKQPVPKTFTKIDESEYDPDW